MPQRFDDQILRWVSPPAPLPPDWGPDWEQVRINEHNAWALPPNDGINDPTDAQLVEFLERLSAVDEAVGARLDALNYINNNSATIPDRQGSPGNTIAYQTALRAIFPDCIYQGPYGFCGPAAIAYHYARKWPKKYAQCVVELQKGREWRVLLNGGLPTVRADRNWDVEYQAAGLAVTQMGPADFLMLHAIRRAAEYGVHSFDVTNPNQASDATPPAAMKKFLDAAGYRDVTDQTFWEGPAVLPETKADIGSRISQCSLLTRQGEGPLVIMLCHPQLARKGIDNNPASVSLSNLGRPTGLMDLHWICVDELEYHPPNVRISYMSNGAHGDVTCPMADFKKCYYGYISAKP